MPGLLEQGAEGGAVRGRPAAVRRVVAKHGEGEAAAALKGGRDEAWRDGAPADEGSPSSGAEEQGDAGEVGRLVGAAPQQAPAVGVALGTGSRNGSLLNGKDVEVEAPGSLDDGKKLVRVDAPADVPGSSGQRPLVPEGRGFTIG